MRLRSRFALLAVLVLTPALAFAQGSVTGQVSDNTGGVLPGVTVEAASPVLIEGSRVAITDGQGRYTIVDLRPGIYSITFTLPGFSTFIRDELEVSAQASLTINAVMAVGGLEETVTVSGESPIVDVQSSARTEVLSRDTLDALPTPRNSQSIGYLAQGVRLTIPDVGGAQMMEQVQMVSHGANSTHTVMQVDGMKVNSQMSDGRIMNYNNQALSSEMAVSTSGNMAEVSEGGLRLNMIPKDGGNTLSGSFYGGFTDGSWQSDNLDQELMDRGLQSVAGVSNIHDVNPAIGGPILQDKLWYFGSFRAISVDELFPNAFLPIFKDGITEQELSDYYQNPDPFTNPNVTGVEDAVLNQYVRSGLVRLTYQASPRHKVSAYLDRMFKFKDREFVANVEPVRAGGRRDHNHGNYHTFQAKWTSTLSSRALLEVGYSQIYERLLIGYQPSDPVDQGGTGIQNEFLAPSDLRTCVATPCYHPSTYDQTGGWFSEVYHSDQGTAQVYNNYFGNVWITPSDRYYPTASFSYVTGSHNIKVGMQWSFGNDGDSRDRNGQLIAQPREGVAEDVTVYNEPVVWNTFVKADRGIYAQDTWTIDRLTVNMGVRFETFQSRSDLWRTGEELPAGRFVGARSFEAVDAKPFWNDIAPRFSVVYDLFGDARTAVKFGVNKFMRPWTSGFAERYTPTLSVGDQRQWLDCALDPAIHNGGDTQCATAGQLGGLPADAAFYLSTNGDGIAQDHEIGLRNNLAIFSEEGGLLDRGVRPDPDLQREYNVEWSASIQHEIVPRVSATFAWYKRNFYDEEQRSNEALAFCNPSTAQAGVPCGDWLPFNLVFDDPLGRLPELAGQQILAFNQDPATQGQLDLLDVVSDINRDYYDGMELSLQARLPNGGMVSAGWTGHKHQQDTCGFTDNPNGVSLSDLIDVNTTTLRGGRFCDQTGQLEIPWRHDYKLFGTYPLPWDFEVSGSVQSYSGNEQEIRWTPPASYYPDGQRTRSSAVQLVEPGSLYLERWNQTDIAFRKLFRFGQYQMSGQADIYNLFNANSVIQQVDSYGSTLFQPTRVLQGRMLRLAMQMSW